ncbi:hypothetical protein CC80DRAFT_488637 [Byssothecium circinans]|uniref:Mid2 domain-containing protein n=1 Tax=Byssothecium circinans TaxID=147558 RepID=A0A6A5U9F0_9PLEO|nr:hypothetical protein CC80DRAFT_488637 [Byssothecium circinans]
MKTSTYTLAISLVAPALAQEYFPPQNNTPALSVEARNPLDRRAIDYCGLSSYYCLNSECCGTTLYNCLPSGAQCCASLSSYGYGLYCLSGSTCTVVGGYVQCQKTGGGYISAGSSLKPTATGTSTATRRTSTATATDEDEPGQTSRGGSSSSSSSSSSGSSRKKTKSKSKVWIAGAVAGPLIGIAVIGAVVFFLCIVKKKQKKKADATNAAAMAVNNNPNNPNNNNNGGYGEDYKSPAYVQQYAAPTPIASPPPQWTPAAPTSVPAPQQQWNNTPPPALDQQNNHWAPASPAVTAISPVPNVVSPAPIPPPQTVNEFYGPNGNGPVSPMSTGNGGGYGQSVQPQAYQPQPVRGNAMELPTGQGVHAAPRNGAQELGG